MHRYLVLAPVDLLILYAPEGDDENVFNRGHVTKSQCKSLHLKVLSGLETY